MSTFNYPPAADITKTPAHQQSAKHNRILIVEDNQLNSKLLKQLLTAYGYEVWESPEGLQALDLARDEQPDLILMDIRLPGISGLEVTRLLKQDDQTKTIPIIAVTALASPEYEKKKAHPVVPGWSICSIRVPGAGDLRRARGGTGWRGRDR